MKHKLMVISVVENLTQQRFDGFSLFLEGLRQAKVNYKILEVNYEEGKNVVPNAFHVVATKGLWNKECALNYLLKQTDSEYVAWVDADVTFTNPDWAVQTIDALQTYAVVQMFSWMQHVHIRAHFLPMDDPRPGYYYQYTALGDIIGGIKFKSVTDTPLAPRNDAHPGLAWAARREVLEAAGGLVDWNIMSGGDFLMAAGFIGHLTKALSKKNFHTNYVIKCKEWERKVTAVVKDRIGFLPGIIHHYFHGPAKRHYNLPSDIFEKYEFDPYRDITKDENGFYSFTGRNMALEEAVRSYVEYRR